ncbi:hypothetical protein CHS0354_032491 [Potamilus streckersoni]|uniref:EF-hand domain-containing protein n=1 Tax=Potamilus streckersoni TaxID=2493646 RepID=A0AAE0SQT6_9BIVA|nr:hypothetical protein CHS0354_032491 [Potamilus streckersoni]
MLTSFAFEAYKESYQFFDPAGKGYITREDFADAIKRMGQAPTEEELDDLCKEYDATGDGKVTFEELLVAVIRRKEGPQKLPERRRVNQGLRK